MSGRPLRSCLRERHVSASESATLSGEKPSCRQIPTEIGPERRLVQNRWHAGGLVAVGIHLRNVRRDDTSDARRLEADDACHVIRDEQGTEVVVENRIDRRILEAEAWQIRKSEGRLCRSNQLAFVEPWIATRRRGSAFDDPLDQCRGQRASRVGFRVRICRQRAAAEPRRRGVHLKASAPPPCVVPG